MDIHLNQTPPQDSYDRGMRASLLGLGMNLLLALGKLIAGIFGHSHALMADATESLGDVFGSVIVWRGIQIASRPPDPEHPYGHGKAEPIAAALVAVLLVGAGIGIAIESVREIMTPHRGPAAFTLVVLLAVIAIKEALFRRVRRVGKRTGSPALHTDAWHHRSDAITSSAAFIGISIALIGGEGYESADDWAALFASAIILFNAYRILHPAVNEIMDAAPPAAMESAVRRVAESVEGVIALEKCFIRKMGFSYYVDLHVTVDGSISVRKGHDIARRVKETLRTSNSSIAEVLVHIEPSDLMNE